MIDWSPQQQEQFESLMEDYKLVTVKLNFLDEEGKKVIEEMMRIQHELQLLYKKVSQ